MNRTAPSHNSQSSHQQILSRDRLPPGGAIDDEHNDGEDDDASVANMDVESSYEDNDCLPRDIDVDDDDFGDFGDPSDIDAEIAALQAQLAAAKVAKSKISHSSEASRKQRSALNARTNIARSSKSTKNAVVAAVDNSTSPRQWITVPNQKDVMIKVLCIDKPEKTKNMNLQHEMGLDHDSGFYNSIQRFVRTEVKACTTLDPSVRWGTHDPIAVGLVVGSVRDKLEYLKRYTRDWATIELIKRALAHRRDYETKLAKAGKDLYQTRPSADEHHNIPASQTALDNPTNLGNPSDSATQSQGVRPPAAPKPKRRPRPTQPHVDIVVDSHLHTAGDQPTGSSSGISTDGLPVRGVLIAHTAPDNSLMNSEAQAPATQRKGKQPAAPALSPTRSSSSGLRVGSSLTYGSYSSTVAHLRVDDLRVICNVLITLRPDFQLRVAHAAQQLLQDGFDHVNPP
ncbi:hypothetical protein BDV93DRAFT_510242 [Ceratobasidium sp. AG-I]|nr:hypothetical protein BDV93DRAFT_510242 [Ceratobasidium sp. AG-I]